MLNDMSMLVRVFKTESYMEQFLNGEIYMNTIGVFKRYEESKQKNIKDMCEGAYRIVDSNKVKIFVNDKIIEPQHIIGPVAYSHPWTERVNVVCLTIIDPIRIRMENSSEKPYSIKTKCFYGLPDGSEELGSHAIIITDIPEFVRRISLVLELMLSDGIVNEYRLQPVIYYNENGIDLQLNDFDFSSVFLKNSKYNHQKEYRIAVDRLKLEEEKFILNIGNLRDICISLDSSDKSQFHKIF